MQAAEEPEAEAAAPALFPDAPLPEASLPLAEEEQPGAKLASELEAELAAAPPAAEAAPEPSAGWELPAAPAEEEAAPMEGVEKEGQDAAEAAEEEGAGEEAAGEEAPEHGSSEEEQEEEPEPEGAAATGLQVGCICSRASTACKRYSVAAAAELHASLPCLLPSPPPSLL